MTSLKAHSEPTEADYIGFHRFGYNTHERYGSFEVFFQPALPVGIEEEEVPAGYYWWACFPGCLPDGDAVGPFESASEAFEDAQDFD